MHLEKCIRLIAGSFVLISLTLGYFANHYWFFFTAFVGANLIQSVFTDWCMMETFLKRLGVKKKSCTIT